MPNHVENHLTVLGPQKVVAEYAAMSSKLRPPTGDLPGTLNYVDTEKQKPTVFNFHGVVPLPDNYSRLPYSEAGYDMEREAWGVKWGPYEVRHCEVRQLTVDRCRFDVEFTTAWSPPEVYLQKAAARFPQLTFALSYGGEGPCRGRLLFSKGELDESESFYDKYSDFDYPQYADYGDDREQEWADAYTAAEEKYVTSHDEWVADIAEWIGASEKEVG